MMQKSRHWRYKKLRILKENKSTTMFKRKNILMKSVLMLAILSAGIASHAQDSTLNNETIIVVGEFKATANDAVKIDYNPQIDPPKLTPPTLTYKVEDKDYKTNPEIIPARPQAFNSKESEKLYGNYTKIGYGMYNLALLETYIHNTRAKNMDYGFHYKFFGGEEEATNQIFSDNFAKGNFTYNLTSLSKVKVNAGYERNRITWYGFNPDSVKTNPNADSTKNIYNNFSVGTYYEKLAKSKNDFGFGAGANYYFQNDHYGNKENYFVAKGEVKKSLREHLLTVPLSIAYTTFGKDTVKYNRLFVDLNPRWLLDYGRLVLNVGFNSTLFHDSVGGKFYFYPYAEFKVKIIENKLNAHLGLDGGVLQNTYATLLKQNPFLDTVVQLQHSNMKAKLFGGFWGSIGSKAAFALEADFGSYLNMPFYLCDTTPLRKYKVIYDNIDIYNVKATLQLQWGEQFKTTLEASYHNYKPGSQLYYWNMPTIDAKLNLQYNYNNKFTAKITAYYLGERFGKNIEHRDAQNNVLDSAAIKLPAIIDLNLSLEYRYNKMISVFVNGSNLMNQAYSRWVNYPGYKLAALGGVAFTF
jgi:hypothetical protein